MANEKLIHDGDFWTHESSYGKEGILISKYEPANYECVKLFLFGDGLENGSGFKTPKELLVQCLQSACEADKTLRYAEGMPKPIYISMEKKFQVTWPDSRFPVKKDDYTETIMEAISQMYQPELIKVINSKTDFAVLSVYCIDEDPLNLTLDETEIRIQQIGYAIVDCKKMEDDNLGTDPTEVAEIALEDYIHKDDYCYVSYFWDDESKSWEMDSESADFYNGDDPEINGIAWDLGWDWKAAKLEEPPIDEEEIFEGGVIIAVDD